MFTWICPKCGREVPPAYTDCPDCAGIAAAGAPAGSAPPQQSQPASPGTRVGRRPLWATGPQESMPPAPPPSFAPPQPPPPPAPAAALPPEAPPVFRPQQATSPMFQPSPSQPSRYAPPPPPRNPPWLTGVAIAVLVVMVAGAGYWFFGRPQATSAVSESPSASVTASTVAGENPVNKFVEVAGVRFSPMTKGIQIAFVVINHADQDLVGLKGSATIVAKTSKGEEITLGSVKFETAMGARTSKELTLPFDTKKKLVDMPDWQNVSVKVQITSPTGS
jgi:hypothetical protein